MLNSYFLGCHCLPELHVELGKLVLGCGLGLIGPGTVSITVLGYLSLEEVTEEVRIL